MSHGKNYRLGFRSLRFYCSTTSMLNQLPDLHLWVNVNFSDAQHFYLENEVYHLRTPFLPMSQGDQETKKQRNLDMSKLIHRFFKIILNQVRVGMEICMGIFSPTVAFSNHTLYRRTVISISFLTPWNTFKKRGYDEYVLYVNSGDKKNQK